MASIKWETAEHMMNIVAFTVAQSMAKTGTKLDTEAVADFARGIFQDYCDTVGITDVEEPEESENDFGEEEWNEDEEGGYFNSDEEEEEEDDDDDCPFTLTPKGEFVARAIEAGISFEDACNMANIVFGDNEGE